MMMLSITTLVLIAFARLCLAKSQIALFSDTNCQNSLRGVEGPNGYPNGTCTDLRRSGPYGSFHVVGLDPGCTVTIYANDASAEVCSGHQEEIQLIDCYNSTYVYYSIDFCDPAAARASDAPSSSPSSSSSSDSGSSSKLPIAAIVGGVVGGVLGLAIIISITIFMLKKKRSYEGSTRPYEGNMAQPSEIYSHEVQEMPTSMPSYKMASTTLQQQPSQPPVELEGHDYRQHGRRTFY